MTVVPLSYTLRSLATRRTRTLLTVLGVALAVGIYAVMSSVADQMARSFRITGRPEEVVVMQRGAIGVDFSTVERQSLTAVQTLEGLSRDGGRALVSPELSLGSVVDVRGRSFDTPVRGVTAIAPLVYRGLPLADGDWPRAGFQAAVGRSLAERLQLAIGARFGMEKATWTVVGIIDGEGRVYDNEIWVDLDDLAAATNRVTYSNYTLRAADPRAAIGIVERINEGRRFALTAMSAADFYAATGGMSLFMAFLGKFIAFVIAIGAAFGGMNTMYSSVAGRRREIGILRSLGYRQGAVLVSFLAESLLIGLSGGLLGLLFGTLLLFVPLELPLFPGARGGLGLSASLSALGLALGVGAVGGLLPALHAARLKIVEAMR